MSIAGILSIARTAITAQQTATQVISQNISNATTEGYSRQRAELTASVPQVTTHGTIGTGVSVFGVTRARDLPLDQTVSRLSDAAQSLNRLSTQVASLNRDIVAAESSGGQSPDLRDARDRLLDQMADIAPIQVIIGSNGRLAVTLSGGTIVDGAS